MTITDMRATLGCKSWTRTLLAAVTTTGLAVIGLLGTVVVGPAAASESPHTVPLNCSSSGDARTTYDASVQPGIIVPDFAGFPFSPTTYTAYGFNAQTQTPQVIGPFSEIATTDHLVAAWWNSTDCGFNEDGSVVTPEDDSRNAWVVDSTGHVFGESDLSGPPTLNFGDASETSI